MHQARAICVAGMLWMAGFAGAAGPMDIFVGGEGGYHTYRIPAMVVTTQGTVLAFCEGRKTSRSDAGDIDLLLRRSTDGGRTWGPAQLVHEEGGDAPITIGNPCPVVDTRDGRVHLLFSRNNARAFHMVSIDDGESFSEPVEITQALQDVPFPWTRLGIGPGHGLVLESGRLVIPLWLNERIRVNYRSTILFSDDRGATWRAGGLMGGEVPDTNECMAVEMADGMLYLNMRARGISQRVTAVSHDAGMTWTEPRLDDGLPGPECQAAVLRLGDGGHVLFSGPAGPGRVNMTLGLSADGGKTWLHAREIMPGPSAYSDLAETADGRILCLFERGDEIYSERITLMEFTRAELLAMGTDDAASRRD